MMAPNPHWWAQKPEEYSYPSGSGWWHLGNALFFMLVIVGGPNLWPDHRGLLLLILTPFVIALAITSRGWEDRGGQRLETRFNHITLFRGGDVAEHEDMRDIVSLERVANPRNGKLKYHVATFHTGKQIRIFHNLNRHDELIVKLQSHLSNNV